jgi:hypothetical protein
MASGVTALSGPRRGPDFQRAIGNPCVGDPGCESGNAQSKRPDDSRNKVARGPVFCLCDRGTPPVRIGLSGAIARLAYLADHCEFGRDMQQPKASSAHTRPFAAEHERAGNYLRRSAPSPIYQDSVLALWLHRELTSSFALARQVRLRSKPAQTYGGSQRYWRMFSPSRIPNIRRDWSSPAAQLSWRLVSNRYAVKTHSAFPDRQGKKLPGAKHRFGRPSIFRLPPGQSARRHHRTTRTAERRSWL